MIGSAPYSGGDVGALTPGGATSIADGLDAAHLQFPAPGANPRSLLLLTDGMLRPTGSTEFPPPAPALRYFLNVVPTGGPRLLRVSDADRSRYYTGDFINPLVTLHYPYGGWPHHADIELSINLKS